MATDPVASSSPTRSAPGISISAVLEAANERTLHAVIGETTLNVLKALEPSRATRQAMVELAKQAAEPAAFLDRADLRKALIDALPIAKARELATNLVVDPRGRTLYEDLAKRAADKRMRPRLASFFGVVGVDRAPTAPAPASCEVMPTYGLFPHQKSVADRGLAALRTPPYKVVVHMPTGAGKTRTALHVIAEWLRSQPDKLVVWLAYSAELLEQAAGEFERAWQALGAFPMPLTRFWGDYEPDLSAVRTGLLVAGLAKVHARYLRDLPAMLPLADRAALTVIDEAHQAIAPTYRTVIDLFHKKQPLNALLGLTATPGRSWANIADDVALAEYFEQRKVGLSVPGYSNPVQFLIEDGYIARPQFRTLNVSAGADLSKADLATLSSSYDIPDSILQHLAADEQRSVRIITEVEQLCRRHRRVIVFASSVAHAHLIASILGIRGLRAFTVTAMTDTASRQRVLTKYRSRSPEPIVLCNYGVLTTGFDAPETSSALIARPTRSLVLYSQMVGRAIRGPRAGGNAEAEIVTVVDPQLPGFGDIAQAFLNWEDVWSDA